jgi:prepilin-type N-terminal cleavage/methylation domain-containing protein
MSIINAKRTFRPGQRGFTLVELMVASVMSALVFAAIFSAYVFMARNLTRLANFQQQQVQNRRVLNLMAKDVNEATQVTAALPALLVLTLPTLPSATIITYTFDSTAHILTRQAVGPRPSDAVLLSNLTTLAFSFYDSSGQATTSAITIKQVGLSYASAVGDPLNGTQSRDSVVSSRMVLRGKPPLGQ